MTDRLDERTHYEAVGDIRYAARYFALQCRLYGKIEGFFKLVSIVAGSSAFAGFVAQNSSLAGIAALVTATATALDIVLSPGNKKQTCAELVRRYTDLERLSKGLSLDELDERIYDLRQTDAPNIEALRVPAYNDSVVARGRASERLNMTRWQRFMAWVS
nr:hypothetical protein [Pseudomonas luteola]